MWATFMENWFFWDEKATNWQGNQGKFKKIKKSDLERLKLWQDQKCILSEILSDSQQQVRTLKQTSEF